MLSFAEENYLKAIYHLSNSGTLEVSTNALAEAMATKPASVSDMIKKLSTKGVVRYQPYRGVNISSEGKIQALQIIRKHRLWEVFLVEKLKFNWDQVHEVAEQLEHIKSSLLIAKLDKFLGFPRVDPHGDPIPDEEGNIKLVSKTPLCDWEINCPSKVVAVDNSDPKFLKHLDKLGIYLGAEINILEKLEFDSSLEVHLDGKKKLFLSKAAARNILVLNK